jgi:ankyrin repeat protein
MLTQLARKFRNAQQADPPQLEPFDWRLFVRTLKTQGEDAAAALIVPGKDYDGISDAGGERLLIYCMYRDKEKATMKFIACGASPVRGSLAGDTPLRVAARCDMAGVVRLLLEKGVDPDDGGEDGHTPLEVAAQNNNVDIIEALVAKGANINGCQHSSSRPLHQASLKGGVEAIRALLKHGAAIDAKNAGDGTALMCAARNKNAAAVQELIDAGAGLDLRNASGQTALAIACRTGAGLAVVTSLLAAGANPNVADNKGYTPLINAAVGTRDREVLSHLLSKGAAIDARDDGGNTALIWSARLGCEVATQALLEFGADPTLRDAKGLSAADHAGLPPLDDQPERNPAILAMLKAAAADWAGRPAAMDELAEASVTLRSRVSVRRPLSLRRSPQPVG